MGGSSERGLNASGIYAAVNRNISMPSADHSSVE
jgi:hypothetical protein